MEFRKYLIAYWIFVLCNTIHAAEIEHKFAIRTFDPPKECLLPFELQNYKLQVLEKTKSVTFKNKDGIINTAIPIFIYLPKSNISEGIQLVNQGINNLEKLLAKPDWSKDEVTSVINSLKQGINELESTSK